MTAGSWVRPGGVVIERTFAEALGVGVGDRITLNGRPFTVAGIAVTAAIPPYPNVCYSSGGGCRVPAGRAAFGRTSIGLIWLTEPDARGLATAARPGDQLRAEPEAQRPGRGPERSPPVRRRHLRPPRRSARCP